MSRVDEKSAKRSGEIVLKVVFSFIFLSPFALVLSLLWLLLLPSFLLSPMPSPHPLKRAANPASVHTSLCDSRSFVSPVQRVRMASSTSSFTSGKRSSESVCRLGPSAVIISTSASTGISAAGDNDSERCCRACIWLMERIESAPSRRHSSNLRRRREVEQCWANSATCQSSKVASSHWSLSVSSLGACSLMKRLHISLDIRLAA